MIVSVPFALQVRSLQELVKLETELARRTACRAQFEQLKSEKLSPCSSGNLNDSMLEIVQRCLDHCQPARSYFSETPKTGTARINYLTGDQQLFAKLTMRLALHFTLFSDGAKHRLFPVNFSTREID